MPSGAMLAASAAASLGGAAIQSGAAGKASQAAQDATAKNLAFNNQVYSNAQNNLNPFITQGQNAGTALSGLLGTGGDPAAADSAFKKYLGSTNYNFVKDQGLQGIEYANAPSFNSGATAKALDTYNTGLAGNTLAGYEALLGGQAGLGATAGANLNTTGTNIAGLNESATQYGANAAGAAAAAQGNAWANALKGVGSSISSYGAPSSTPSTGGTPTPSSAFYNVNTMNLPSIFGHN